MRPCRRQPPGELAHQAVIEIRVRDPRGVLAGVEEAGVVHDPLRGDGQVVESAQVVELLAVRVAEADELPEEGRRAALQRYLSAAGLLMGPPSVWKITRAGAVEPLSR
ncbi:hypothetical protein SHKM778_70380 [Streptomyces sp. KM77-8]|uniref:Uncharacterized protein n=1 Tax=Streptomyces haneummycinicus TaxID=3074435 RepID=A0AAT9HTT5_9ACTN